MDTSFTNAIKCKNISTTFYSCDELYSFGLKHITLRDYQVYGTNWLLQRYLSGLGCILSDEMGLGKTCQTIGFIICLNSQKKCGKYLVVCPLSVLNNWAVEFSRFAPSLDVTVYNGSKEERYSLQKSIDSTNTNVLLTTYEIILRDEHFFSKFDWDVLVVDEGHRLKNNQSQLFQSLSNVNVKARFLLTGTPIQNNLSELYSLLHFVAPKLFSFKHQNEFECRFHSLQDGDAESQDLQTLLKPFILRRTKEEVLRDLPVKSEILLYHGMTELQKRYYKGILTKDTSIFETTYSGNKQRLSNILIQLRKCVNHPYLFDGVEPEPFNLGEHLIEASGKLIIIDDLLKHCHATGHKVLLFSQMTRMLDILQDYLTFRGYAYERLDGSVRGEERFLAVKNFNDVSSNFVFLLSTRAGGVGLNLISADTVIFVDSDFNPQNDLQAAARAHRIGQTRPVKIIRLVGRNTVEEIVLRRAMSKLRLTHNVVGKSQFAFGLSDKQNDPKDLFVDEKVSLQDILKFGVHELLKETAGESGADERIIDLDSILGVSENGQWIDKDLDSLNEDKRSLVMTKENDHMYLFEGHDYSQEPSAEDHLALQSMIERQLQLAVEENSATVQRNARRTRDSAEKGDLFGSIPERRMAKPRKHLTPEQLAERKRKREENLARKLLDEQEQTRLQAERRRKQQEALWRANDYESLCVPLGSDSDSDAVDDVLEDDLVDQTDQSNEICYLVGDVTQPSEQNIGAGNTAFICHCLDEGGKWGRGGLFSALSSRSAKPQEAYELAGRMNDLKLGDVHLVECDDLSSRSSGGRDFAALLVAQSIREARALRFDALQTCLRRLRRVSRAKGASVHLPRIGHATPGFNWYAVEKLVRKHLTLRGIRTCIYYYPRIKTQRRKLASSSDDDSDPEIERSEKQSKRFKSNVSNSSKNQVLLDSSDDNPCEISRSSSLSAIFSGKVIFMQGGSSNDDMNSLRRFIEAFDGKLADLLDDSVTHVVVLKESHITNLDVQKYHIVSSDWIKDSVDEGECLTEEDYRIV